MYRKVKIRTFCNFTTKKMQKKLAISRRVYYYWCYIAQILNGWRIIDMKFSKKAMGISPSLTLGIDTLSKEMKAQGKDVISFGVGEPDLIPQFI